MMWLCHDSGANGSFLAIRAAAVKRPIVQELLAPNTQNLEGLVRAGQAREGLTPVFKTVLE